jgi:APA family basic amino acid/polyamine antiporter
MVFHFATPQEIAIVVLLVITVIHCYDVGLGGRFQNAFTSFKILLILVFIVCGFLITPKLQGLSISIHDFSFKDILTPGFAISLFWVSYAFSGWNATAYIASEVNNPKRNIPKSLFFSTLLVTFLYFFLNLIFLLTAPVSDLIGKVDVGNISAVHIFGQTGGSIMSMLISILLISTISSMVFVGPRVSQVMGEDLKLLKLLSVKTHRGTPLAAILLQCLISLFFILTMTFDSIILCVGFILTIFTFLTVAGVFIHRYKFKDSERPYKTWGYPVIPIIFLGTASWSLWFLITTRTRESIFGFIVLLLGTLFYLVNYYYSKKKSNI